MICQYNKFNTWVAGDAGLYFTSVKDVESCIDLLLGDPALAKQLSLNAVARFESEFTWDHVAGQYEALLRKTSGTLIG